MVSNLRSSPASGLGPRTLAVFYLLIFLLLLCEVNDLPAEIQSYCRLFADDDVILYNNTSQNRSEIEQDLNHLLKIWGENWQMSFNVDKCVLLPIGSKALASHLGYSFCGTPLKIVNSHSYLGIQL